MKFHGNAVTLILIAALLTSSLVIAPSSLTPASASGVVGRVKFAEKVVLLSIDAARIDYTMKLAEEGLLPGFKKVMENGVVAAGMIVSFPSETSVSHAVISTGAPPGTTGITGNNIHLPGTAVNKVVSGFDGSNLQAEPLWATLERQGLKAVVAAFPQSTPSYWAGRVNTSILFNPYDSFIPVSYSTLYTSNSSVGAARVVNFKEAVNWSGVSDVLGGVSLALEAEIPMGDDKWYLYLADINGDGYPDKVAIVPLEKDLRKAVAVLGEGEWSKPVNTTITVGGVKYIVAPLFKALNLSLENFRLYRSLMRPFNGSWFNNYELAWKVWNNVVVKTGMITDGDWFGLVNEWFDPETYMETVHYTNEFFKEFTLYLLKNTEWDLLMSYTPIVDNVYHQFLGLVDPSMPYYDESKASLYWSYIVRAHQWADEILKAILENVDLSKTVVVVVSDHGQWPVKKLVNINSILYNAGLISVDEKGNILWSAVKAYYTGSNQIFVNLKSREENGVVGQSEYEDVVRKVMSALASIRDPETGEPVFGLIMRREEARVLGLYGDRVGDVVFSLRPGYSASTSLVINKSSGEGIIFSPAIPLKTITGTHADLPFYPQLLAVFGAIGSSITPGRLSYISSTSIAPTIAYILGIAPPLNATGIVLPIVGPRLATTTTTEVFTETATKTLVETRVSTTMLTSTNTVKVTEVRTETLMETETTTLTVKTIDTSSLILVVMLALVVGAALGGLLLRKR